jgi:pyruvate, orthophosphate dikinase
MGLSRNEDTRFQHDYEKAKIFANDPFDPFAVLDQEGVGKLVKIAVESGRKTR